MDQLNPQQRAAVRYTDGPLLVLAGAGTGKTRVITRKIAHLVGARGLAPHHVFAVTFTNKAAREMQARVARMPGVRGTKGLGISTFHTLGLRILREEHRHLGYRAGLSIVDARDSAALLADLGGGEDAACAARIGAWKSAGVGPEAARAAADASGARAADLYARYQRQLLRCNAVDFDDLILKPLELLRDDPHARARWQARIRYLLVDEYQDTNAAQYALLRLLVGPGDGLTVVGDDDQSVYGWRGARPENIDALEQDFPRLEVIRLEQNYRSSARILAVANGLIGHNEHVYEKRLWSALGPGEPVRVLRCADADAEAERVAAEILRLRFSGEVAFGDCAVLYRGNHQSRALEKALRAQRIPYRVSGGPAFFDRAEVKDTLAYLRVLANPHDDIAFLRIVNTPRRAIGAATLEALAEHAGRLGKSLLAAASDPGLGAQVGASALARLARFADWVRGLQQRARREDPVTVAEALVDQSGYRAWLREGARDRPTAARREESVGEVIGWLRRLAEEAGPDARLDALVAQMCLLDVQERDGGDQSADQVRLMTLHAAKGLEFPHVFLVGLEEGLLPHRASLEAGDLAEERRLAYVGLTRAQRSLTLTYTAAPRRGRDAVPSRFLAELPDEHVVREADGEPADPDTARESGKAQLARLRELIGR